jgi:Ca-activated chloride channel family protein
MALRVSRRFGRVPNVTVALIFGLFLLISIVSAQEPQPTVQPTVQPVEEATKPVTLRTDLVTLTLTVMDPYGRYVSALPKKVFSVFDNNVEQEITYFSDSDAPVSLGILFDVSGSMSGEKIQKARHALERFLATSHPSDEYFLIAFNTRAQLLLDRTRDSEAVLRKLTLVEPKRNTALYDAVYLGVDRVSRGAHQKRALLIISDGQDNSSRYNFNEVRRIMKESDIVTYAVGIMDKSDIGNPLGMQGQAFLDELTSVTGGKSFYPTSDVELDDVFERIAVELRHQYYMVY